MDVLLETKLESLFFNYLSFDFFTVISSLWTWVAVFSAALLSFSWQVKIRTTVSSPTLSPTKLDVSPPSHHLPQQQQQQQQQQKSSLELLSTPSCPGVSNVGFSDGMRKGKFTMCLEEEEEMVVDSVENEDDGEINFDDGFDVKKGSRCESWEYMRVRRCGDFEWHRCLDLNSLNGKVVKLWEDEKPAYSQFR